VSRGSKGNSLSTSPFTLNTRTASLYCFFRSQIWWTPPELPLRLSAQQIRADMWHCRIPITDIGEARITHIQSREKSSSASQLRPQKFSLTLMRSCSSFPPALSRTCNARGPNAGRHRGVLTGHRQHLTGEGIGRRITSSDASFTKFREGFHEEPNSSVEASRPARMPRGEDPLSPSTRITAVELMPVFPARSTTGGLLGSCL